MLYVRTEKHILSFYVICGKYAQESDVNINHEFGRM
jgi:hypothetical protein